MKVVITRTARTDLAAIEDYIAGDNPTRAATFSDELIAACESIIDMSLAYPIVPRYADRGYRRKVHGDYLIVYSVGSNAIEILHIVHGARDLLRLLEEGGR